jgi:hypothetical protein
MASINDIKDEYENYLTAVEINSLLRKYNKYQRSILQNIIENWLMLNINNNVNVDSKELFSLSKDSENMINSAMREKKIINIPDKYGDTLFSQIKSVVSERTKIKKYSEINAILKISTEGKLTIFRFNDFKFTLTTKRMLALQKRATDKDILRAALRYETIFSNHRQWCACIEIFQHLVKLGANIEGFASPFNAQIIQLEQSAEAQNDEKQSNNKYNYKFCSLFFDTDNVFGSLGSFFKQEFNSGEYVIANPPKILEMLERTTNFCLDKVAHNNCKFTLLVPKWEDAIFYKSLDKCSLLEKKEILKSRGDKEKDKLEIKKQNLSNIEYYSEDPFTGKIIYPNFQFCLFTITSKNFKREYGKDIQLSK